MGLRSPFSALHINSAQKKARPQKNTSPALGKTWLDLVRPPRCQVLAAAQERLSTTHTPYYNELGHVDTSLFFYWVQARVRL